MIRSSRKIHKYLSLAISVQLLLWTISGIYFSFNKIEDVRGSQYLKSTEVIETPRSNKIDPKRALSIVSDKTFLNPVEVLEITEDQPFIPILDLGARGKKKIMVQSEKSNETNPIEEELKSFVNSIQTNKNPIVDLKSAQSALQLALDIAEQITMTQN